MKRLTVNPGDRFGSLTIVEELPSVKGQNRKVVCRCECNRLPTIRVSSLTSGATNRCNECRKDRFTQLSRERNLTHGKSKTSIHNTYLNMISRCFRESHPEWKHYGGRGISVCDRWLGQDGFANFAADMGDKPSKKHSLDRIANDLGYSPDNCQWTTQAEQVRNRRVTVFLTLHGRTQCMEDWARELGWSSQTIKSRRAKGWNDEKILTTPVSSTKKTSPNVPNISVFNMLEYDGKCLSVKDWAILLGIAPMTLTARLRKGWTTEKTLSTSTRLYNVKPHPLSI